MALIYKSINSGESLTWQDKWDMTNKEGEKVQSGKYKAIIKILGQEIDNKSTLSEEESPSIDLSFMSEEKIQEVDKDEFTTIIEIDLIY